MHVQEALRGEEVVGGLRESRADARDGTDGVGSSAQVRDAAQELQCVALLL